jgi:tetratricopeptide (TPR) repeat protein
VSWQNRRFDYLEEICGSQAADPKLLFPGETMLLRFVVVGGGLLLLALLPTLADVVTSTSSRRGILHCLAAEELLAAGWLLPAEREFRRALRLQPMLGAAHCGLAKIRLQQERFDEAIAEYRAAVAALRQVDRALGRREVALPEPLTSALVDALEQSGRHAEADEIRRSNPREHLAV